MSGEGLAITWLGQAGFLLQAGGTGLLVDAFLSPHPERQTPAGREPAGYQGLAAVLATHEHIDHLDLPSWPALAAASPQAELVVPAPVTGQVTGAGLPPQRVRGAVPGGRLTLGEAVVTPLPARHGVHVADAYNFGEELSGGACRYLGYVVDLGGVRVYHAGDTIDYPELAGHLRELDVDLALLPVNGRDAAREARDIVGNLGDPGRFVDLLRRRSSASAVVPAPQRAFCYRRVR